VKKASVVFSVLIVFFLISCVTFDHKNPYPNMNVVTYGESHDSI
jgi:hypothetical protein